MEYLTREEFNERREAMRLARRREARRRKRKIKLIKRMIGAFTVAAAMLVIIFIMGKQIYQIIASDGEGYQTKDEAVTVLQTGTGNSVLPEEEKENVENSEEMTLDLLEKNGCPASLIELYQKNPDARNFVLEYKEKANIRHDMNISGEVTKGTIPLFLQWDERWGYENYGSDMMAITACGPTSLSMVYSGLTGKTDMNPYEMAKRAEEEGFYVAGAGSSWAMMTSLAQDLGLTVYSVDFNAVSIKEELRAGNPIICIMGPGRFTDNGHFIVLTGLDEEGNIIINDPNSITNSSKTWEVDDIMTECENLWAYSYDDSYGEEVTLESEENSNQGYEDMDDSSYIEYEEMDDSCYVE